MSLVEWRRVEYGPFGVPNPDTLPPDGARVVFYRLLTSDDRTAAVMTGTVRRHPVNHAGFPVDGQPLSWESASLRDITMGLPNGIDDPWALGWGPADLWAFLPDA